MAKYRVVCYIRVDAEDEELYDSFEEANQDANNSRDMFPDNIYKIEEVEDDEC